MTMENNNRCPQPKVSNYFRFKNAFDRVLAFSMLIVAAPIILVLVVITKLTSKGPGFYSQIRLGKDGKEFRIYKIRSMRVDAEVKTGAVWAARKDPRITLFGNFLRASHLDELPQLINVLRGDMSLVGPRPERPEFVGILDKQIDGYSHRLMVKPGVTGFAQLNLPSDIDLNDVRRKLALDFEYIENASISFDIRLIVGTAAKFAKFLGVLPLLVLGIHRKAEDSQWAEPLKIDTANNQKEEVSLATLFSLQSA